MATLNWTAAPVRLETDLPDADGRTTRLSLHLGTVGLTELRAALEKVFAAKEPELRLSLPDGWTLFWKCRDGDNRALLAHPDDKIWVGTVALNEELGLTVVRAFDALGPGQSLALSRLGAFAPVSNLELVLLLE
jgi:hypothetical protein